MSLENARQDFNFLILNWNPNLYFSFVSIKCEELMTLVRKMLQVFSGILKITQYILKLLINLYRRA